jgi:hypothetical protein
MRILLAVILPTLLLLVSACRAEEKQLAGDPNGGAVIGGSTSFTPPALTLVPTWDLKISSPVGSDCNRPSFWVGDAFYQMVSNQHPWRSRGGADAASSGDFELVRFDDDAPSFDWDRKRGWYVHDINTPEGPTSTPMRWMESVYRRPDTGILYGLYHLEEGPYVRCPAPFERPYMTVPHIGLAKSTDDGRSWHNLGIVISDGSFPVSCTSEVQFFTGGVGDPSMAVDADGTYAYIVFTDYSGSDAMKQGIQIARIPVADLDAPLDADGTSKAMRWHNGRWSGPGLQGVSPERLGQSWPTVPIGQATPLLAPERSWQRADGGGFWGPSLSWNTHLSAFVLLLNNVSGARAFDAEGNYITYLADMRAPAPNPSIPVRINDLPNGPKPSWYVQALGDPSTRGTSALTGQDARLFMSDHSNVLLHFE